MIKKTINNMEKVNIAELLKDCPSGMELDCTMYDNVVFECVKQDEPYPINVKIKEPPMTLSLSKTGGWNSYDSAKCVIYPKGKTTWEGFVPPCEFKDGDIVYVKTINHHEYILIFKEIKNDHIHKYVCFSYQRLSIDKCPVCLLAAAEIIRLATEEERQELFDAIKANGYHWNADTKTLEKLIEPKFKVGNKIVKKDGIRVPILITGVGDTYYWSTTENSTEILSITEQDDWELFTNKFDTNTLKPFESRVLVRDYDHQCWKVSFFGYFDKFMGKFDTVRGVYIQCIPYEGNEHLLNTNKDCDDFYKTWE